MLQLKDAIKNSSEKELFDGVLKYKDQIPCYFVDIENKNLEQYYLLKMLNGQVSKQNITIDKSSISQLYIKYIHNQQEVESILIDEKDIDALIELRLMIDDSSQYCEIFDKLMFHIYFEKDKPELSGLIHKIYDEYPWAKEELIKIYNNISNKEKCLIFHEDNEDYSKKYGIKDEPEKECSEHDFKQSSKDTGSNMNELLKQLRGENNSV